MVLSWGGGDTRVGGASSPAEGSPAKTSRVGKANLRIQPMPQHNKAHFLSQPQSQDGSAWVLPRDLPKTIQSRPRELQKSRPERERGPPSEQASLVQPLLGTTCKCPGREEGGSWEEGCVLGLRRVEPLAMCGDVQGPGFGFFQMWLLGSPEEFP